MQHNIDDETSINVDLNPEIEESTLDVHSFEAYALDSDSSSSSLDGLHHFLLDRIQLYRKDCIANNFPEAVPVIPSKNLSYDVLERYQNLLGDIVPPPPPPPPAVNLPVSKPDQLETSSILEEKFDKVPAIHDDTTSPTLPSKIRIEKKEKRQSRFSKLASDIKTMNRISFLDKIRNRRRSSVAKTPVANSVSAPESPSVPFSSALSQEMPITTNEITPRSRSHRSSLSNLFSRKSFMGRNNFSIHKDIEDEPLIFHPTKEVYNLNPLTNIKIKGHQKTSLEFSQLQFVQYLGENLFINTTRSAKNIGDTYSMSSEEESTSKRNPPSENRWSVLVMKFSLSGEYLAVGCDDGIIRIWTLAEEYVKYHHYLKAPENELKAGTEDAPIRNYYLVFSEEPIVKFSVNFEVPSDVKSKVLDLSWGKNDFLISCYSHTADILVWHVSHMEPLARFTPDLPSFSADKSKSIATTNCVAYYPNDDRYFISGSGNVLSFWHVPTRSCLFTRVLPGGVSDSSIPVLISCLAFTPSCYTCLVGTNVGKVYFYEIDGLKYNTQHSVIPLKSSSNTKAIPLVSCIECRFLDNEHVFFVTTVDGLLHVYRLHDKELLTTYHSNLSAPACKTALTPMDLVSYRIQSSLTEYAEYIVLPGVAPSDKSKLYIFNRYRSKSISGSIDDKNIATTSFFSTFFPRKSSGLKDSTAADKNVSSDVYSKLSVSDTSLSKSEHSLASPTSFEIVTCGGPTGEPITMSLFAPLSVSASVCRLADIPEPSSEVLSNSDFKILLTTDSTRGRIAVWINGELNRKS